MNQKEKYLNRRNTLDLFDPKSINGKQGFVKIWGNDLGHCKYDHEKTKFDICYKLRTEYGFEFWTEVELKNGKGRVDILTIDKNGNGTIIEVLDTESDERFNIKLESYPLPIIKVRVKDYNDDWCL